MSAPAPARAESPRPTAIVRIADAGLIVACLSLAFGLLLVFFPVSFPRILLHSWQTGHLTMAMMVITLAVDASLYLRVTYRWSGRPTALAAACLGAMPILVAVGLSFLLQIVVSETVSTDMPNLQARVNEEILAHTYLGLVSGVFLPFLVIRLLQPLKAARSSRPA